MRDNFSSLIKKLRESEKEKEQRILDAKILARQIILNSLSTNA